MKQKEITFSFIEDMVRTKTFGIINTVNQDGSPHTTGVLYAVSPPESKFALYVVTSKKYKKAKNIKRNPAVSFIITFPHHFFRFVPSNTITFNGKVEILPFENEELLAIFTEKRILRMITKDLDPEEKKDYVFLKIIPEPKVQVYGVGYNIFALRGGHTEGGYAVRIPAERLD
ncbi:MAG: pyridoxamine 5'-phosphate oxidase family protein [Candidatus Heimdallarchaeaceae archaeon]|jgi:nitroimidazol reductase NimA-like FMN-containing flavoprotein (pyridoxamine 5'-phosphate oxidase superfamily)